MIESKKGLSREIGIPLMEGGRRPTGVNGIPMQKTSSEVLPPTKRRRLTTAYKIKVVNNVASLKSEGKGVVGAYLRSEGLYYSSVSRWAREISKGQLTTRNRGRQEKSHDALLAENKKLRRQLAQAHQKLEKTEMIVDLQKKLSSLMETSLNSEMSDVR